MTESGGRPVETICVMGLGYVGLPTAAVFAVNGFRVIGVDLRQEVVESVNTAGLASGEIGLKTLVQAAVNSGNLRAQLEPQAADAFIIAVPTPMREDHVADLSYVEGAARSILPYLSKGNLVILESTSPPGTTDGMLTRILSESGLLPKQDLSVAYCAERVLPGRILAELVENDRVIGGVDQESGHRAAAMYRRVVEGNIVVTSATMAEVVKLIENAYRDVNIAFANEVARISRQWGVDGRDAIRLANRHPRVDILHPGPGVGGHCIPVDPWFLVQHSPNLAKLVQVAREVNDAMPAWVAERTLMEVRGVRDPKISVWGVAYKANVDDARETPALPVIRALEAEGARVSAVDFHVSGFQYPLDDLLTSVTGADCILLLTDHREFALVEPGSVRERMRTRIVFDTRGCLRHRQWEKHGFRVVTL